MKTVIGVSQWARLSAAGLGRYVGRHTCCYIYEYTSPHLPGMVGLLIWRPLARWDGIDKILLVAMRWERGGCHCRGM
jgi:hypothetical protein